MNLEHVSARKSPNKVPEYCHKPIQLSIFPKVSLRPAYRVSNLQIERFMRRISAIKVNLWYSQSVLERYLDFWLKLPQTKN